MTVQPNMADVEIRAARASESSAVRRLVPTLYKAHGAPDQVIVAMRPEGEIVGVLAIAWRSWGTPGGFPMFVHVEPQWRRRGIGRALVGAGARACQAETQRFHGWVGLEEGSAAAAFAHGIGGSVNRRVLEFEADLARFYSMIDAIHGRLQQRSKIPGDATVVPLARAPAGAVARLVSETFGSRYDALLAGVRGDSNAYDRERSVVLVLGGQVRGALLYRWRDGCVDVDVNVVAPALRRGWANVALLREATRNALEAGATRFRFKCDGNVADTVNLARRVDAMPLRATLEFVLPIESPVGAPSSAQRAP